MEKENQTKTYRGIHESPFNKGAGTRRVTGGSLKRYKGITLIALVITIVLMLILATITVNVVIDGNLFEQAGNAKKSTEIASEKSAITQASMMAKEKNKQGKIVKEEIEKEINKIIDNAKIEQDEKNFIITIEDSGRKYFLDNKGKLRDVTWSKTTDEEGNNYITKDDITLQIGDYITYDANDNGEYTYTAEDVKTGATTEGGQIFSSDFETTWRLLGVEHADDGDYLMIVPETPIQSTTATGLTLKGESGYENGIDEIENISKLYGHGNGALSARSMIVEDINKITGYDPLNTGDGTIFREGELGEYQNEVTCTREEFSKWTMSGGNGTTGSHGYWAFNYYDESSKTIKVVNVGESMILTSTFYGYYPTTLTENSSGEIKGIAQNSREYSALFETNKNYWLASSHIYLGNDKIFPNGTLGSSGFHAVGESRVWGGSIFNAGNSGNFTIANNIMPIVYLKADVNLKATGNIVNECTEWEIY